MKLTKQTIKDGLRIRNIEHPEWGTWRVVRFYASNTWEINNARGMRILDSGEFSFWEIVP
jgi:hypothetical protein